MCVSVNTTTWTATIVYRSIHEAQASRSYIIANKWKEYKQNSLQPNISLAT